MPPFAAQDRRSAASDFTEVQGESGATGLDLDLPCLNRGSFTRRRQGLEFTWFERASGVFAGQLPISFPSGDGEVSRVGVNRVRGPLPNDSLLPQAGPKQFTLFMIE